MEDKILQTKKAMIRIVKAKGLTRLDKYNLLKEKSNILSEKEKKILLMECRMDYEVSDEIKGIKDIVTVFLTGSGMFLTVFGVFYKGETAKNLQFATLIICILGYIVVAIAILLRIYLYRINTISRIKYLIDILEE